MMAAVQPFLSGAISKTCNVPHEATVDDIRDAYLEGWKLGLKALAIYRDGSKGSQPVDHQVRGEARRPRKPRSPRTPRPRPRAGRPRGAGPLAGAEPPPAPPAASQPRRERLPHTRRSLTHKFDIQGHEGYINVGFYPDGRPGELFITMAKEGSTIGGLMDVLGTAISIGLQYGVPLEVFVNKFAHSRFEPAGFTKNPDIPIAKSIADYIFRWLGMEFIPGYREANAPKRPGPRRMSRRRAAPRCSRSTASGPPPSPTSSTPRPSWAPRSSQPAVPQTFVTEPPLARRPERAGPPVRPLPERRPRLRQLRRPDRPLRHLLPLLQLRQQHGLLVSRFGSTGPAPPGAPQIPGAMPVVDGPTVQEDRCKSTTRAASG